MHSFDAFPNKVWDGAEFYSTKDFSIELIQDSVFLYNDHFGDSGAHLSAGIFSEPGVLLGYGSLDGVFLPGYEHAAYVTFQVRINESST